ncbi:hypothetical protein FHS27_004553 [Rhodopirellula rubra]|uniref:Uncharacterized protein n=1 Tax=Aporhodopirellula rubra TaxID=980271 RepID=A0A7W5E1Z6_9BACT|nr:hypothetical protein [Aporhodopirellula rubra]
MRSDHFEIAQWTWEVSSEREGGSPLISAFIAGPIDLLRICFLCAGCSIYEHWKIRVTSAARQSQKETQSLLRTLDEMSYKRIRYCIFV